MLRFISFSVFICCGLLGPSGASVAVAQNPRVRTTSPTQATVYTARIAASVQATPTEMARLARERGSVELIEFVASGDPAVPDHRVLLRLGEADVGFPGFSIGVRKALRDAIAKGSLQLGQKARTYRSADPSSSEFVECVLPEKPGVPFSATVRSNGAVKMQIRQDEIPIGPNATPWPSFTRTAVPNKGVIVQVYDYGPPPDLPPLLRRVTGRSNLTRTGILPSETSAANTTDSVSFTANWGWSTGWDSGYVPPGFPVQIHIGFGGGLALDGNANGTFSFNNGALCAGSGSSSVCEDIGIEVIAEACVDFYIINPICFDIPYVPTFDLRTQCCDTCSSFSLNSSCCCSDTIQRQQLWCYDLVPIPRVTVGGCVEASMSADICQACDSMTTSAGSFTYEGQCRNVSANCEYHSAINYNDYTTLATTVHLYPTLVACLDIWGSPCLDFAVWDFAWTLFDGPVDQDFSKSSLDFYNLGDCNSNSDCSDGDSCTNDWCDSNCNCHNDFVGQCRSNGECNDGDLCTNDWCDSNCNCHNDFVGQCRSNGECNDGDPCTNDWCDSNCNCHNDFVGQCRSNGECNDSDPCTIDYCQNCSCQHDDIPGCCPPCGPCETCQGGTCLPIQCGPCETCQGGVCASTCGSCESCQGGICVSGCDPCETCQGGDCVSTCESCESCQDGICVSGCPPCETCQGDTCVSECGPCELCQGGTCVLGCGPCDECVGGVCVGNCGNGTCEPNCKEDCESCPADCNPADCPPCLLYDMNNDGFISIIGDVPFFVNCVYFGQCECPCDPSCVAPGDCNGDGFLSIIGDVPCFVECVYFGNCGP